MTVVHQLSDEIGSIEALALNDAVYVPQSDCFKEQTADAQAFLQNLESIKSAFATANEIAGAVDTVVGIISKL
jgi:hypothetical protein